MPSPKIANPLWTWAAPLLAWLILAAAILKPGTLTPALPPLPSPVPSSPPSIMPKSWPTRSASRSARWCWRWR